MIKRLYKTEIIQKRKKKYMQNKNTCQEKNIYNKKITQNENFI